MKRYIFAAVFEVFAVLLLLLVPAGDIDLGDLWIPFLFVLCILATSYCIGAEIFFFSFRDRRDRKTLKNGNSAGSNGAEKTEIMGASESVKPLTRLKTARNETNQRNSGG